MERLSRLPGLTQLWHYVFAETAWRHLCLELGHNEKLPTRSGGRSAQYYYPYVLCYNYGVMTIRSQKRIPEKGGNLFITQK